MIARLPYQLTPGRDLAPLKTSSGSHDVSLIPGLAKTLREYRMASLSGEPRRISSSARRTRGRDQRSTARAVERTFKRDGLDGQGLSSHSLRHTYASLLIVGAKLDPVAVAAQLGHSNPATTLPCTRTCSTRRATPTRYATSSRPGSDVCSPRRVDISC